MTSVLPPVAAYLEQRAAESGRISETRKRELDSVAQYVQDRASDGRPARLIFICTHNSRRSQFGQFWTRTAAAHQGIEGIEAFSGGTEATAFNRRAVDALRRAGFDIVRTTDEGNPIYEVRHSDSAPGTQAFSKVYDQAPNPSRGFCAVMTCSRADVNCPVVAGASLRVAIPYEDPGNHDGTAGETRAYDDCCRRISREIVYFVSRVRV